MKKSLVLGLMLLMVTATCFAGFESYSFVTGAGWFAGGNLTNGGAVYNPDLQAVFVGQYNNSGLTNRSSLPGFTVNPAALTYGTITPAYFLNERTYGNGVKLAGVKNNYGHHSYFGGKLYVTSDHYTMANLNYGPKMWVTVNADSVTVNFPNVSTNYPLWAITGISSTASNVIQDANGTPSVYAGTAVNTTTSTTDVTGWNVVLSDNNRALMGVTGVYTGYDGASTWGTNFFTGGGYSEPPRSIWLGVLAPASTPVEIVCTDGKYDPNTGVIDLSTTYPPGFQLFADVRQLQPSPRGVWKWDATTLASETGISVFGVPAMFVQTTVASKFLVVLGVATTTTLSVAVPPAYPITDQYLVTLEVGGDTGKARRGFVTYGNFTAGPLTAVSNTQVVVPLNGKPMSGVIGVFTSFNGSTTGLDNFWGRRTFAGWLTVTDTTKIVVPWGPIDRAFGAWTTEAKIGRNWLTGDTASIAALSVKAGGIGGWWNQSTATPTIYFAVGGMDTTLAGDSVYVTYDSPPPDGFSPALYNVMDTTGVLNLAKPLPQLTDISVVYSTGNGLDVANNHIAVAGHVAGSPALNAGDTVYVSLLYQGGSNPYNYTGAGTANNRSINWNPYGVDNDGSGNFIVTSLFSNYGVWALDAAGNNIAHYAPKGAISTVTRGGCAVDKNDGDIYWPDQGGSVLRFQKTGPGLDTYVQDDEPFFIGSILGSAIDAGSTPGLTIRNVENPLGGTTTLVFICSNRTADLGNTNNVGAISVLNTAGQLIGKINGPSAPSMVLRGVDVVSNGADQRLFATVWAAAASYNEVQIWMNATVPVELSRFESVVE